MSTPTEVAALITATNNLTQTVIDKRSEITTTVTAKIAELDAWKAALVPSDAKAEPRYHSVIDLTGLPTDRFYPVWWTGKHSHAGVHRLTICRRYDDDFELDPFGTGIPQSAGLLLEIETVGTNWSGDAHFLHVKRLTQTYRQTVRLIRFAFMCASFGPVDGHTLGAWANGADCPVRSGLYLRGGMKYQVYSNQLHALNYSRLPGPVTVYEETRINGTSGRWQAQSHLIDDAFLGADYADYKTSYGVFPYES